MLLDKLNQIEIVYPIYAMKLFQLYCTNVSSIVSSKIMYENSDNSARNKLLNCYGKC